MRTSPAQPFLSFLPILERFHNFLIGSDTKMTATSTTMNQHIPSLNVNQCHAEPCYAEPCYAAARSRPRSRAIAIKRTNNGAGEATSSAENMYDYATWQMYNRIIEYRLKNPVGGNISTPETAASSPVEDDSNLSEAKQDIEKESEDSTYDDIQGDIFHMEL
jgi:hypothetical protein